MLLNMGLIWFMQILNWYLGVLSWWSIHATNDITNEIDIKISCRAHGMSATQILWGQTCSKLLDDSFVSSVEMSLAITMF